MLQNITITLFLLFGLNYYSMGQNLVPNSSFEGLENDHSEAPKNAGELEHLEEWVNFGTSDLLSDENGKFNGQWKNVLNYDGTYGTVMNAHTGHLYIGFGPCEGAQVRLKEKTGKQKWVTVSYWFSPRGKTDTEINAFLLKEKADGIGYCRNPSITYETKFTAKVNAAGSDAIHSPGNWYYYKSKPQLMYDDEYEWFAMKGRDTAGVFDSGEYVFIDDVEVTTFDFCSHFCLGSGPIRQVQPEDGVPNAMHGNSQGTFYVTFENANDILMQVYTPDAGCLIHEWHSFSVNGLVDPGFTDFAIIWNGNTTVQSSCHPGTSDIIVPDVYVVDIIAKSCSGGTYRYTGSVTATGILNPPAEVYPPTVEKTFTKECCPVDAHFQNQTVSNYLREDVERNIYAGSAITSGAQGPFVLAPGADVRFYAGNNIIIDNGFIVSSGARYVGEILPCGASPKRVGRNTYRDAVEERRRTNGRSEAVFTLDEILVSPNPSAGVFTVELKNFNTESIAGIEVFNAAGTGIRTFNDAVVPNAFEIDLSSESTGMYLLKVTLKSGKSYTKTIVKN